MRACVHACMQHHPSTITSHPYPKRKTLFHRLPIFHYTYISICTFCQISNLTIFFTLHCCSLTMSVSNTWFYFVHSNLVLRNTSYPSFIPIMSPLVSSLSLSLSARSRHASEQNTIYKISCTISSTCILWLIQFSLPVYHSTLSYRAPLTHSSTIFTKIYLSILLLGFITCYLTRVHSTVISRHDLHHK